MSAYLWVLFSIVTCIGSQKLINANVIARGTPHFIPDVRVLNGDDAVPHSAPYMAALKILFYENQTYYITFCGGTLISHNYVLTAAHCLKNVVNVTVVLGVHNWRVQEPSQVTLVSNSNLVNVHKLYVIDPNPNTYDIAVVGLPSPVAYNQYIQPVQLPADDSQRYQGQTGRLYGWGYTWQLPKPDLNYLSSTLKYADLAIAPTSKCIPQGNYDGNICIMPTNGRGTCGGDSGGPLITNGVQIGITSYGVHRICDVPGKPAYFTRVGKFLVWIRDNTDLDAN